MRNPLHQGKMDGLCGIYALVNGISVLVQNRLSTNDLSILFKDLVRTLYKRNHRRKTKNGTPIEFIWEGTNVHDISLLLRTSRAFLAQRGLSLTWTRPLQGKWRPASLNQYWDRLRTCFLECDGRCVAIIDYNFDGIDGEEGHWTCVEKVTDRTMKLLDSSLSIHSPRGVIRKGACTLGEKTAKRPHRLFAHNVYLVQISSVEE
jgi:hypothetical protein